MAVHPPGAELYPPGVRDSLYSVKPKGCKVKPREDLTEAGSLGPRAGSPVQGPVAFTRRWATGTVPGISLPPDRLGGVPSWPVLGVPPRGANPTVSQIQRRAQQWWGHRVRGPAQSSLGGALEALRSSSDCRFFRNFFRTFQLANSSISAKPTQSRRRPKLKIEAPRRAWG